MRLPMNVFLFIGLISGAIAGGLIEYVLGFILPKKPKYTHFIAIGIAIIVFTSISIWPNISGENPGKEAQQISIVDDELKFALRVHTVQIIGDYFDINGKGTFSFHTNMIPTNGNWFYGTYPYPGMYYEKESAQILRMDDFNISLPGIKSDTIVYLIFLTFAEDRNNMDADRTMSMTDSARIALMEAASSGEKIPDQNFSDYFAKKLSGDDAIAWAETSIAGEIMVALSPENNWMIGETVVVKSNDGNMLVNFTIEK